MARTKATDGPYWSKAWTQQLWEFTNQNFVDFDTGAVDYERLGREEFEFRKAMFFRNFKNSERARIAFAEAKETYDKRVNAGQSGGRPTSEGIPKIISPPPSDPPEFMPFDKSVVTDWAEDNGLDRDDAGECWEATKERRGKDGFGNTIMNWKGYVTSWCKTRKKNRKQ